MFAASTCCLTTGCVANATVHILADMCALRVFLEDSSRGHTRELRPIEFPDSYDVINKHGDTGGGYCLAITAASYDVMQA